MNTPLKRSTHHTTHSGPPSAMRDHAAEVSSRFNKRASASLRRVLSGPTVFCQRELPADYKTHPALVMRGAA